MVTERSAYERVPLFMKFLRRRGNAEIGEPTGEVKRCGLLKNSDTHTGIARPVYFDGEQIGVLEFYSSPYWIIYAGRIPNMYRLYKRNSIPDKVRLIWHDDRYEREDGWELIPFP